MTPRWLDALADAVAGALRPRDAGPAAERHVVRGFPVLVENGRADIATADVLVRLDEAIALAERHQPWRVRHMRRDVRAIRVTRWPCRGAFLPAERVVLTELTFLARRDIGPATVASSFLHEGVHARVHAMGVGPMPDRAAREERLCRRAELAFGLALPPDVGAPVVERARDALALDDAEVAPTIDWSVAARRIAAVDGERGERGERAVD
ncbi:MAG TPA: hypothetical protein VEZ47_13510 [Gemmatirosa sp.]|nr:hypothetical protein [Gemmatirosa sp.]